MLGVQNAPTFLYTRLKYGTPEITRDFKEAVVSYLTPMLAERSENRVSNGRMEYLFNRLEETLQVVLMCEPDDLMQLRWFYEDHGCRGKQFQFWINRNDGSYWGFDDTLRDQNRLPLVLNTGTATYESTSTGRGIAFAIGQSASVTLAQASAATKTGFDDPLDYREGVLVVDLKPAFASSDATLHVLLDTSAAGGGGGGSAIYGLAGTFGAWGGGGGATSRLQLRKTVANALELEITDGAGNAKVIGGAVTWSANARVQIVGSWTTAGVLALWYAVDGGSFTALTSSSGVGTGILASLPTTLYVGSDNGTANFARGTYDHVFFAKSAFTNPHRTLATYKPVWRNYFPYAELQRPYQPARLVPSRLIWTWPFLLRNGVAA